MKTKKIIFFTTLALILIFVVAMIYRTKLFPENKDSLITSTHSVQSTTKSTSTPSPSDKPQIVSTKPDPLDNAIIPADQVIEITFNRPLENVGEFKVKIDPKVDVKIELSGDRKTGKITPVKFYELGTGYTISIGPDTKFDGVGEWGQTKSFQFRTIKYTGV